MMNKNELYSYLFFRIWQVVFVYIFPQSEVLLFIYILLEYYFTYAVHFKVYNDRQLIGWKINWRKIRDGMAYSWIGYKVYKNTAYGNFKTSTC